MSMSVDPIEQTEQRLAEVEALQLTLKELHLELSSYRELLSQKLALLRGEEVAAPPVVAPAPRAAVPVARAITPAPRVAAAARAPAPTPLAEDPEESIEPVEVTDEERRSSPRRKGNPVSVQVTDAASRSEPFQGWVVDRSSGGVRLLVDQSVAAGTILNVRPSKAHPSFTWIQVKVKSCRPERSSWNLGCQFVHKLSWAELQVFG